jgi:hypothetical protein
MHGICLHRTIDTCILSIVACRSVGLSNLVVLLNDPEAVGRNTGVRSERPSVQSVQTDSRLDVLEQEALFALADDRDERSVDVAHQDQTDAVGLE